MTMSLNSFSSFEVILVGRITLRRKSIMLALALLILSCGDVVDRPGVRTKYDSGRAALDDHGIERGVLPKWLPADATEIYVETDLDVGRSWARFKIDPGEMNQLFDQLSESRVLELEGERTSGPPDASWWDECAGVNLSPGCEERFSFYVLEKERGRTSVAAIDEGSGIVYFWTR
jgi:hypothetical protein